MQYATSHILGQVLAKDCPSRVRLEHLANKWSMLVLHCLSEGLHRFSELRQRIEGVSEKMLAQTLKTLEQDGLILRTVYPTVPPKVEYQLTFEGSQIAARVNQLIEYLEQHLPETSQQSSP